MLFKGSAMSSQTSKHSIVKILEHYGFTIPSNRGGWQSVRCLFHNDHVKSARVNIDGGGFRCFACDMAGDVYSNLSNVGNNIESSYQHKGYGKRLIEEAEKIAKEQGYIIKSIKQNGKH